MHVFLSFQFFSVSFCLEFNCFYATILILGSSNNGGGKLFSLKKWNAVAMWSWDVECDTCAICRVQVRIRHCLNFLSLFLDEVNIHFTSENTCTLKHTWKYMYLICRWWTHVCAVRVSQKLTPKVAARTASSSGENATTHSITAACHYGLNRCDHYRKNTLTMELLRPSWYSLKRTLWMVKLRYWAHLLL